MNRNSERKLTPSTPRTTHERVIAEAVRGSLGWAITGAIFGAAVGWERGGVSLGIAGGGVGALVFAMVGWVLGTAVGIAEHWPVSQLLVRVLGGTFLGAVCGLHLVGDSPRVPEDHKHLVALLWALVGALLGVSTSVKFVQSRTDRDQETQTDGTSVRIIEEDAPLAPNGGSRCST